MGPSEPRGPTASDASRASLRGWLRLGFRLPKGVDVEALDVVANAPAVIGADAKNGTWYLPVRILDASGSASPALLRGVRLDGVAGASPEALETWRQDHGLLADLSHRVPGLPRALDGIASDAPSVLPPLYHCTEKRVFIPAPQLDAADPQESLWRAARKGEAAGPYAAHIACLECGERDKCFPASGPSRDPGTAGTRLVAISDRPWGGLLVEPFHLPFQAWLRLASGTPWHTVRGLLAAWPPPLLTELDRAFGGARATILGPEHGGSFALETLLLRLEWLRQTLVTLRALADGPRRPHLGIGPETLAVSVGPPSVWAAPLWSSRVVFLTSGAARETPDGSFEPLPGRSTAMVPPECRGGAAWIRGRCLPRGSAKTLSSAKTWDFNFLPSESATQTPGKGTAVRFALDDSGEPSGPTVDARVEVAFRDVWVVTVGDPRGNEAVIREMLQRDDGRPPIVMQAISDHGLSDDLYAVGSLWLSTLVAEPGSVPAGVKLREALRVAPADAPRSDAAEASGPCYYVRGDSAPERRLPVELIDSALELGNRLCGGVAGAYPGQGHGPVAAEKRAKVYDDFLGEIAMLASDARQRLFGYSPADAEIRSLLEGAFRAS
jgi:hypothetical protein